MKFLKINLKQKQSEILIYKVMGMIIFQSLMMFGVEWISRL